MGSKLMGITLRVKSWRPECMPIALGVPRQRSLTDVDSASGNERALPFRAATRERRMRPNENKISDREPEKA
jgi:dihydropteroate synthase